MPDGITLPGWPRGMRVDLAAAYVGISASLLMAEVKAKRFPEGVRVTPGRLIWLREDLDGWVDEKAGRPHAARTPPDADELAAEWDAHFRGHRGA